MRAPAFLVAAILALATVSAASADGEVGLVIQIGEDVETHCIAYTGDSITGEQALLAAGKHLEQYGGSGGRTVCSINETGCSDASSFSSCFCECQSRDCTYWGFFTRKYGANWVYSTLAFNLLQAKDGDLHGWKWGVGGPASAPAPVDITFEQVCGHAPRGGAQPTATSTTAPAPTATTAPATAAPTSTSPTTGASSPAETVTVPPSA
jgi:cell division septation protein DedD